MREFGINVLSNAYAGFSFMLLLGSLLAAVALLIIMRQTGLLRRKARWHRMLVCLYYLYIPAVFVICGGAWSTVKSVERAVLGAIEDTRPAVSKVSVEYASAAWLTVTSYFKKDSSTSLKEMYLEATEKYANKLMEDFVPERVNILAQPIMDKMKDGMVLSIAQTLTDMALKKASGATGFDRNLLRSFWETDLTVALQNGLISDIITQQAEKVIAPLYTKVKLIFTLLMLPVVMETGFALYRRRKAAA